MISLPPFIMTSEKGSFARKTIEERKPLILDQVLADFDYPPSIRERLLNFKQELKQGFVAPLEEAASDREVWELDLQPWLGKTWLEIPWFLAETFFYRKLLEIVHYFQPGPWMGVDPYQRLKDKEIDSALSVFIETYAPTRDISDFEHFQNTCYSALWGNRGDLSNLHVFESDMGSQEDKIILNQTKNAFEFLRNHQGEIAYIFDNVGKELYFDLAFIDYLLQSGLATRVTCYVKNQPFFVSDVMEKDLMSSIYRIRASNNVSIRELGNRLLKAFNLDKLTIDAPPFFTTSQMYRQFPEALHNQIKSYELTILKGDVNYRRLFGDRHWDPLTPVAEAAGYFPTSFLSLRTLKGEIILGMTQESIKQIQNEAEPDWLINGKRGMITFHRK